MKFLLKKIENHYYIISNEMIPINGYRMDINRNSVGFIDNADYYNCHRNEYKLIIASTNNLERVLLIDFMNLAKALNVSSKEGVSITENIFFADIEMTTTPTCINKYGELQYNKYEPKLTDGFINILKLEKYETD